MDGTVLSERRCTVVRHIALFSIFLAFAACDDSTKGKGNAVPDAAVRPPRDAAPPPSIEDALPTPEPDMMVVDAMPPAAPDQLVIDGDASLQVRVDQSLELVVFYRTADGDPIADGEVKTSLLDLDGNDHTAQGIEGSVLEATTAQTDARGRAVFTFLAGPRPTTVRVHAEADNAAPVAWRISVVPDPIGRLTVRVTYDDAAGRYTGASDFSQAQVMLVNAPCAGIVAPPRNGIPMPLLMPFDGDESTTGENLPSQAVFSAVAFGNGPDGHVLALGCTEGITILGGQTVQAEVPLTDMALEYKGVYVTEQVIDLTGILAEGGAGDGGQQAAEILDILGAIGGGRGQQPFPRGDGIVQLVCDRGGIAQQDCDLLRAFGAPVIEQVIDEIVPPEVLDVLDVLGDIYGILSRMTVLGELHVSASYPDENGLLPANEMRWQGLRFVWRLDCPFDEPADCTRDFSLIEAGIGARTITAVFDAEVRDEDLLYIAPHEVDLHLGRLALALVEAWVLPAILDVEGPVFLEEFFGQLLPCADINAALPPFDPASGFCEQVILQPLADLVRQQIDDLVPPVGAFTFEGTVRAVDARPDLLVDSLLDGVWNGTFGEGEDRMLIDEIGTWWGCRLGQCPGDAIEEGMAENDQGGGMPGEMP